MLQWLTQLLLSPKLQSFEVGRFFFHLTRLLDLKSDEKSPKTWKLWKNQQNFMVFRYFRVDLRSRSRARWEKLFPKLQMIVSSGPGGCWKDDRSMYPSPSDHRYRYFRSLGNSEHANWSHKKNTFLYTISGILNEFSGCTLKRTWIRRLLTGVCTIPPVPRPSGSFGNQAISSVITHQIRDIRF